MSPFLITQRIKTLNEAYINNTIQNIALNTDAKSGIKSYITTRRILMNKNISSCHLKGKVQYFGLLSISRYPIIF